MFWSQQPKTKKTNSSKKQLVFYGQPVSKCENGKISKKNHNTLTIKRGWVGVVLLMVSNHVANFSTFPDINR